MQPHQKRGLLISALGLICMLAGGVSVADFRYRIAPARFLVEPMNLVVTPDEANIVVGSRFEKLQVFEPNGRTRSTWALPTDGGPFRLALPADDRIQVATAKNGLLLEYDLGGELISERADAGAYERLGPEHERAFTTPSGTRYRLDGGRLIRDGSGAEEVLVNGFATHGTMTRHMIVMGLSMLVGVLMLIGGFISTGRRASVA